MPRSTNTTRTYNSTKTASDVLDLLDTTSDARNLRDAKRFIRRNAADATVAQEAIGMLESPVAILQPISSIPDRLVKSMFECNACIGGIQATSIQMPLCNAIQAPWDFFCSTVHGKADEFVAEFHILTNSEKVEHVQSVEDQFSIHVFRKSINGTTEPLIMRIFVSSMHPFEAILDMKNTHQQSIISACGVICFWPKLMYSKTYIAFENNRGLSKYPSPSVKFTNKHSKLSRIQKGVQDKIQIITGLSNTEHILFENIGGVNAAKFKASQDELRNIAYAVSSKATKYLGHTNGM